MNKEKIMYSVNIENEAELVNILSEIAVEWIDEQGIDGEDIPEYLGYYLKKIIPLIEQNSVSKSLTYGDNY